MPGSYLPRARITVDRARRSRSSTVIILGPNALGGTPLIDFCMGGYLVRDPGAHRPLCQCSLQCALVATNVQWRATN